jgi:BirA family transcriptional regulator, biotin operon repressor / biotin---[acetyl-CoA-carboxylase] ligase
MAPRILRESIDSTQAHAIAEARAGAEPGTRFVARRQSRGLGRSDHRWASPPGGLYLSTILEAPAPGPTLLPLAIGAELGQALATRYGVHTLLKWPNDLVVFGERRPRKLAGILCDRVTAPWGPAFVVGVGLNVSAAVNDFPLDLRRHVVGLSDLVRPAPDLDEVEAEVVAAVERAARGLGSEPGRNRLLHLCRESLYGIGRRALVDGRPAGIIRGINDDGSLSVVEGHASSSVHAGSLLVEEAA